MRARNVVFTQFLSDDQTEGDILDPSLWPDTVYVVWQLEMSPETGRLHIQGYAEFTGKKSWDWIHENCEGLPTARFDHRRGTQSEAIAYCKKDESRVDGPYEWGERREQGKRSDLEEIRGKLVNRVAEAQIADDHFSSWVRYHKSFREFKRVRQLEEVRDWPMEIIVFVGPSGTGKSSKARADYPGAYWGPKGKWWDGYCGQETVVVDEMYGHRMPYTELLQLLDRYPYQVENKGGMTQFISRRIVFTSNQMPEDWYDGEKTHQMDWSRNPLKRRLDEFGRIIMTGEVHRTVKRVVDPVPEPTAFWNNPVDLPGRILDVD